MNNARAGDRFGQYSYYNAKHGSTAIKQLSGLELIEMDLLLGAVLKPLIVCRSFSHYEDE